MRNNILILVVILAASSACAFAGDRGRPSFDEFDQDGDNKLSREEFAELSKKRGVPEDIFDRLDTNDDGFLSKAEMRAGRGNRGQNG